MKYLILFFVYNFASAQTSHKNTISKTFYVLLTQIEFGKLPPKYDTKLLARLSHSKVNNFTSFIGGKNNGKILIIPIDNKVFNFKFIQDKNIDSVKNVTVTVRQYIFKKDTINIAIKVKKYSR